MSALVFATDVESIITSRIAYLAALSDDTGEIVLANDNVTRMYGYLPGELIGKSVDDLVPPELRAIHRQHRIEFNKNPVERAMGVRMELRGSRKNGSQFTVRIQLIPCVLRGVSLTIAKAYQMGEVGVGDASKVMSQVPSSFHKPEG